MKYITLFLTFIISSPCFAGGLGAPSSIRTSKVLPKGVRTFGMGALTTEIDTWHNSEGNVTGVAEPMVRELSYNRLLKAETNEELKRNIEASLSASGIAADSIAGVSLADVNTRVTATVPSVAVGVTSWWTVGVGVPIVYTNIDVEKSFEGTPALQGVVSNLSKSSRAQTKLIEQKLGDVIATELAGKNYLPLEDREKTEVGDVAFVSKMSLYSGVNIRWSLLNKITAPTARTRAINRLVDPAAGDGQWDLSAVSIIDVPISSQVTFYQELGYIVQMADHQDARIPFSKGERLSSDIDESAYRDLGDIAHAQLGFVYTPTSAFSVGLAYYASHKQRDYWTGGKASQSRYDVLGTETEQYMQAALVQLGASTVASYRKGKFPMPLTANLSYSNVFDGRNVRNAPLWSFNVTMFF